MIAWERWPVVEFPRLRGIDFYPPRLDPSVLKRAKTLCLGTKNRTLGDAVVLSRLPRLLKAKYPGLSVQVYPRGFNRAVFSRNPWVSSLRYFPGQVYGDDANWGSGHLIELKEQFFHLEQEGLPRGELYLSPREKEWGQSLIQEWQGERRRPVCVIHPWGGTQSHVIDAGFWESLVARWQGRVSFVQVGIEGQRRIQGCAGYLLLPRAPRYARRLFALLAAAQGFVGVDSGPMHVASAFDLPSLILTNVSELERVFEDRKSHPYYHGRNWLLGFLYPQHQHVSVVGQSVCEIHQAADFFLEARVVHSEKATQ